MAANLAFKTGIVKLVNSGDNIIIRKEPKGGPPPEKNLLLSNITAPKLARQKTAINDETKDEPFAWEAREFIRQAVIGKEIAFTAEKNSLGGNREYGCIWSGIDPAKDKNLVAALVSEGLVKLREGAKNVTALKELEDSAIAQRKGIWCGDEKILKSHIREVTWTLDNPKAFIKKHDMKPIKAIVEYVRDGSTLRLCLLPDYIYTNVSISGIRCPTVRLDGQSKPFAEEARFFVEKWLLQRDIEVILESYSNNTLYGSIIHPQGNIAEALLSHGFAMCVDWSMTNIKTGKANLRAIEKIAKEKQLRIWKDYQNTAPQISPKEKEFSAVVYEVLNGDALNVKLANGTVKKIFLSSIRPPKEKANDNQEEGKVTPKPKTFKPLYQIPWMFEAREFLRTKVIGKRVQVIVDSIQPAKDTYPEKICCSVYFSGANIAEGLVAKGLASVVKYKRDDDQRCADYDKLLEAEEKAMKAGVGIHAKKDIPVHRIQDTSNEPERAKRFLPFLKRAQKLEAVVEFVANGARMRLLIPKESVVITFLLAGIDCPRGARPPIGNAPPTQAEPYADQATAFTKDKCLQRNVTVTIEDTDKAGNFFGWLFIENENLSVALVEAGLASVHFSAETSEYARQLKNAEESAKSKRLNRWSNYDDEEKPEIVEKEPNTIAKTEKVFVTYVNSEGHIYAVKVENGVKLTALMEKVRKELESKTSVKDASYTPKKGEICAAIFDEDGQWYRAKVEKVQGSNVSVFYLDYGNKAVIKTSKCAPLSATLASEPPYAQEYSLVLLKFPLDEDDREMSLKALREDTFNQTLTVSIVVGGAVPAVRLFNGDDDIGKALVADGLLLVESSRPRSLLSVWEDYKKAQESALSERLNIWKYGDITDDDAREFGLGR